MSRRRAEQDTLQEELSAIRGKLDSIDSTVLGLFHDRLELVRRVGEIKELLSRGSWAPAREKEVLDRLIRENRGRFPERALCQIFREVFSVSRQQERPIRVIYQGPAGSLTHAAATEQFGVSTQYERAESVDEVFDRVGAGAADYGVVPPEVSCEGVKTHSLEAFLRSDLKICAEYYLSLDLALAVPQGEARRGRGGGLESVREVLLQPQVYDLVREWIALNLPGARPRLLTGSAEAAEACREGRARASVTLPFTARSFGLRVVVDRIPYGPVRKLRFLTAGRAQPGATKSDKTTIAFSLADRVGVLEEALRAFRKQRVSISFLESHMAAKASPTLTFFVDVLGHVTEPQLKRAVLELRRTSAFVKVLGSYPVFRTE